MKEKATLSNFVARRETQFFDRDEHWAAKGAKRRSKEQAMLTGSCLSWRPIFDAGSSNCHFPAMLALPKYHSRSPSRPAKNAS